MSYSKVALALISINSLSLSSSRLNISQRISTGRFIKLKGSVAVGRGRFQRLEDGHIGSEAKSGYLSALDCLFGSHFSRKSLRMRGLRTIRESHGYLGTAGIGRRGLCCRLQELLERVCPFAAKESDRTALCRHQPDPFLLRFID